MILLHSTPTTCLVLIGLLAFSTNGASTNKKPTNKCNKIEFEDCVIKMMPLSNEAFIYPTNLKAMNSSCREIKTANTCSKEYTQNCLKGETRNTANVIIYGISRASRFYCSNTRNKNTFISIGKCSNAHRSRLAKANESLLRAYHAVHAYPEKKMKFPLMCCSYFAFKRQFLGAVKECSEDEVNRLDEILERYASDGFNLGCADYSEDSDRCTALLRKMPRWTKPLTRRNFFLVVIDILNSL